MKKEVIESISSESRIISASAQFKSKALIHSEKLYESMYKKSIEDPAGFWGEQANQATGG